jgi:hypothetical protein
MVIQVRKVLAMLLQKVCIYHYNTHSILSLESSDTDASEVMQKYRPGASQQKQHAPAVARRPVICFKLHCVPVLFYLFVSFL